MSLLWMDNFDSYGTDAAKMLDGLWSQADGSLEDDPDGVSTGKVIHLSSTGATETHRRALPAAIATAGCGFRVWYPNLPSGYSGGSTDMFVFADENNVAHVTIGITTTGVIKVWRGTSSGTEIGTSTVPAIVAGAWNHVECKATINDSTGAVEVRVNGVQKVSVTGVDTRNGGVSSVGQVRWGNGNVSPSGLRNFYLKDVVAWSTSGSYNNDFMGDVQVVTLRPSSDVALNWTPSTGSTGWDLIDESTPSDTDYISNSSTGFSTFGLTNLSDDVTGVKGLMMVGRMLKTDGGTGSVQMSMISNGDEALGSDRPITTAATYWFDINETDPDTSLPWDRVAVNAASIKINRTA